MAPLLETICPSLARIGTLGNPYDVANEVMGQPLFLYLESSRQLSDGWDGARHFN